MLVNEEDATLTETNRDPYLQLKLDLSWQEYPAIAGESPIFLRGLGVRLDRPLNLGPTGLPTGLRSKCDRHG